MGGAGRAVALVLVGSAVGTLLRITGLVTFPPGADGVPWITLAENLSGALLLGAMAPRLLEREEAALLVGTGILGSYTTFSALALELAVLFMAGAWGAGMLYLGLSLFLGPPLALAGWAVGGRWEGAPSEGAR
jgi:fluoride exporter